MKTQEEIINELEIEVRDIFGGSGLLINQILNKAFSLGVEEGKKKNTKVTNNNDKLSQSYLDGYLVGYNQACEEIKTKINEANIHVSDLHFNTNCDECGYSISAEIIHFVDCFYKEIMDEISKLQQEKQKDAN